MKSRSIAKILKLKGYAKEQIEMEVRKNRNELNDEKMKLDSLEDISQTTLDEFHQNYDGGPAIMADLELFHRYFSNLNRRIELQRMNVHKKMLLLDAKLKEMYHAYKEERLIEIVHERLWFREVREVLSSEQKEMDYNFLTRRQRE
jgi:flagellar export protein FliJ